MGCLAQYVSAVIDAVEIDRLAVVVRPCAMRRRCETDHRCQRRPAVDMRHYLAITYARWNVIGPPHDAGYTEPALERRSLFSSKGHGAGVRPCVLPRAVVCRNDDDRVGSIGPDFIYDLADVRIQFQHGVRIIAEMRFADKSLGWNVRIVHLHEIDIHE